MECAASYKNKKVRNMQNCLCDNRLCVYKLHEYPVYEQQIHSLVDPYIDKMIPCKRGIGSLEVTPRFSKVQPPPPKKTHTLKQHTEDRLPCGHGMLTDGSGE